MAKKKAVKKKVMKRKPAKKKVVKKKSKRRLVKRKTQSGAKSNTKADKRRTALAPGVKISSSGKRYTERRPNRTDKNKAKRL